MQLCAERLQRPGFNLAWTKFPAHSQPFCPIKAKYMKTLEAFYFAMEITPWDFHL